MRFFLLFWLLLVAALSLAPLEVKSHLGTMGIWHNLGHLVIFFVTTLLLCRHAGSIKTVLARCGAALLLALGTEALEKLMYHNPYEWNDVGVDALGVLAALAVATLCFGRRFGSARESIASPLVQSERQRRRPGPI